MLKGLYSVRLLCKTLGCSRSGYYDLITLGRPKHKAFNQAIDRLIMETYLLDTRWVIRQIRMQKKRQTAYVSKTQPYTVT